MDKFSTLKFPVICGLQAGQEYYITMWSLKTLKLISIFDESELPPELRAQRLLNRSRIPEMTNYMLDNPNDYVFSALTVSIDAKVEFESFGNKSPMDRMGTLTVPMDARFIINDGQHRRAAILAAIEKKPALASEDIAVVFFIDNGLTKCQQMFADLNQSAICKNRSISRLYDSRNDKSKLARLVVMKSKIFNHLVDMKKNSLAIRSKKLFAFSAFFNACSALVDSLATGQLEDDVRLTQNFWDSAAKYFPVWIQVSEGLTTASTARERFIHSNGIALQAIGGMGNQLIKTYPETWQDKLKNLEKIDWAKSNTRLWEGRALINGKVSKISTNVTLTTNVLKKALGLSLNSEEERIERVFESANHENGEN